ncbi:unnamed protein product [Phaeothamnion confervicola]
MPVTLDTLPSDAGVAHCQDAFRSFVGQLGASVGRSSSSSMRSSVLSPRPGSIPAKHSQDSARGLIQEPDVVRVDATRHLFTRIIFCIYCRADAISGRSMLRCVAGLQ